MADSSSAHVICASACLAGVPCRYDGASRPDSGVVAHTAQGEVLLVCPEVLGGLPTPRLPAEIVGGDGVDVLAGSARVVTVDGDDVTDAYVAGARKAADFLESHGVTRAILQPRSPACGIRLIYDGTHEGTLRAGDGVFTAELKRRGIAVSRP